MPTETDEITRIVASFAEAWNRHDMAALAALFAPDAEFVNVVGMWWKGRAEIERAHRATHATIFKDSRLTILGVSVRFPTPRLAIARSRWRLENHVGPDGAALPARNGVLVNVLALDGGTWSILDAQNTDVVEGVASRPQ